MIKTILLLSFVCLAANLRAEIVVQSNFDTGLDGWTAVGLGLDTSPAALTSGNLFSLGANPDMVHDSGGDSDPDVIGNPGGFARLNDATGGLTAFARAPAKFTGDLSLFFDVGNFSFQHRLFTPLPFADALNANILTFIFVSGDLNDLNAYAFQSSFGDRGDFVLFTELIGSGYEFDSYVAVSGGMQDFALDPITDIDLGVFSLELDGSTLSGLSGGALQTSMTLEQVLANVTDVFITFERVDSNPLFAEVSGIDNIILQTPNSLPPRPEITSIARIDGAIYKLTLAGEPGTDYEFRSSATLDFTPGDLVENLTQGLGDAGTLGGSNDSVITTDSEGSATVRISIGGPAKNFVRGQSLP